MPVYDYKCPTHGNFYELASLDDHAMPAPCPECGQLSPRIIVLAPSVLDMAPENRKAYQTNEKARHEPLFSTQEHRNKEKEHAASCGCGNKLNTGKLFYTPEGNKMFPSMRPWMISH